MNSTVTVPSTTAKARRFPVWAMIVAVAIVLLAAFGIAMLVKMSYVPASLDTSTTMLSAEQRFQVTYQPDIERIPINQIHTWTLHVEDASGQPVENADIHVDGGMPQHGHGLPTAPEVTESLGNGDYRVEGMKFNMPGWWVVTLDIDANGTTDRVTYNLTLN